MAPNLAFGNEALLYSIFSLSARHMADIDPQHTNETMDTHRRYLDLALRRHSDGITNLNSMHHVKYLTRDCICHTARPLLESVYTTSVMIADDEECNGCLQGIMEVDRKRRELD